MRTRVISFDLSPDRASGERSDALGREENRRQRERAKLLALRIIREQLSDRQREYLLRCFVAKQTLSEIARDMGVNKSTVSRTVTRALRNVRDRMRYYDLR